MIIVVFLVIMIIVMMMLFGDCFYFHVFDGNTSELVLKPFLFKVFSDDHEDAFSLFVWTPLR